MSQQFLVTGSSGLIGSSVVAHFAGLGWRVHGVDNNLRADFFGPAGDTRWNQKRLEAVCRGFTHHELDVRDRGGVLRLVREVRPRAIFHAAGQPSHDLGGKRPFDDFDVNAVGTLNLLEAARQACPESPFVFMSTNKVYGDAPNELPLVETETRRDYARAEDRAGVREDMRIDRSKHSLMGASKTAADVLVQEYGRYFGLPTCCLRAGCVTGASHAGVELHGFLSYLVKVNLTGEVYRVYGYQGKQVRDNIDARDIARFIECFLESPRTAEVYNIGGGRANSCSIREAFALVEGITGKPMRSESVDRPREGDHICYISSLAKIRSHHPRWDLTRGLAEILRDIASGWSKRLSTS